MHLSINLVDSSSFCDTIYPTKLKLLVIFWNCTIFFQRALGLVIFLQIGYLPWNNVMECFVICSHYFTQFTAQFTRTMTEFGNGNFIFAVLGHSQVDFHQPYIGKLHSALFPAASMALNSIIKTHCLSGIFSQTQKRAGSRKKTRMQGLLLSHFCTCTN